MFVAFSANPPEVNIQFKPTKAVFANKDYAPNTLKLVPLSPNIRIVKGGDFHLPNNAADFGEVGKLAIGGSELHAFVVAPPCDDPSDSKKGIPVVAPYWFVRPIDSDMANMKKSTMTVKLQARTGVYVKEKTIEVPVLVHTKKICAREELCLPRMQPDAPQVLAMGHLPAASGSASSGKGKGKGKQGKGLTKGKRAAATDALTETAKKKAKDK
jgi:hypothetical protein